MAGPWSDQSSPLLSGLFGVLQSTSAARASTADTWAALREAAGTWAAQTQGIQPLPSTEELQANGAQILHDQGVGIQEVNTYRSIANEWRSSKEALHAQGADQQITGRDVFVPPWSQTADSAAPDRYRVRVEWEVTPTQGDAFTTWASYELDSPLTSLEDLLDQAGALVGKKPTSGVPLGGVVTGVNDYELEQI